MRNDVDPFLFHQLGVVSVVGDCAADCCAHREENGPISRGKLCAEAGEAYVMLVVVGKI